MIRIRVDKVLNDDFNESSHLMLQSSKCGTRSVRLPLDMRYDDAAEAAKYLARLLGPSTLNAVEDDYLEVDVHR